ncbi:Ulp1 protease family, carboxy-terminal domain protein [Arachis hypogaea]|uniref:Ulp1 protease family, carboxy-terminal domain protein n=1 Tax=Arachis hypogaea TaxID=3818 RepID=A0A6B9VBL7_ARAHY|nr:Ulp1 protease family, carboxy-terminal domain protein [Arachis hypogaea]
MGLDDTELEIAAYLYGNYLMDNYEEDIVFSELTARRDVFRSLMPGKPIISLVLDLVADMMKTELTRESEKTKLDPDRLPSCITYVYLGKVDCLKRVFIPVSESTDEGHEHWYLVFEFEEPEGLPTLEAGSNDAGVRVASWMIACVEDDHFNIKVDDGVRMKIAVSLVSKNHNMISYRVKRNAIENLNKLYDNHHPPASPLPPSCCHHPSHQAPLASPPQLHPSGRVLPHVSLHHDTTTPTIVSTVVEARHHLLPDGLLPAHHRACCDSALHD